MSQRATVWATDRGTPFYRIAALLAIGVAFAGFFLTYVRPMALGSFAGPAIAHLHGALLACWLLLVAVQSFLLPHHRLLGWLALAIVPGVLVSTVAIGVAATRRDLHAGITTGMAGNVTAPLLFAALVAGAIGMRMQPHWHKRMIFIATAAILWPAWFRWRHFLPTMNRPDIVLGLVLAQLPLGIAMMRDWLRFRAVHPAYLYIGIPVMAEQAMEAFAFGTPWWSEFGLWFYRVLQ